MSQLTFNNIYYRGQVVLENDLFIHKHTPEMLLLYDGNFIQFKRMPSVAECKEALVYLRDFHVKKGQKHIKLLFPENRMLPIELSTYLKESGFDMGFMELYSIEPNQFPGIKNNARICVEQVTDDNYEGFLTLKNELDSEFGRNFAEQKRMLHEQNFKDERFLQVMAYYDKTPVGVVDVIIGEDTAEIDGLVVLDSYQKKGIGSHLQKFVMETFSEKRVILIADGEDTPKEMYLKQNYQFLGFKYEAIKVYED